MEILSQAIVYEDVYISAAIFWIAAIPLLIGLVVAFCTGDGDALGLGFSLGILALVILGILYTGPWCKSVPTDRNEYKVTLDVTYPAEKLYDEYIVVGREGKIWTIQDKAEDDLAA